MERIEYWQCLFKDKTGLNQIFYGFVLKILENESIGSVLLHIVMPISIFRRHLNKQVFEQSVKMGRLKFV